MVSAKRFGITALVINDVEHQRLDSTSLHWLMRWSLC